MAIERYIVRYVSCDRGINVEPLDGRFGVSVKDENMFVFDSIEEAQAFSDALVRALDEHRKKQSH